jgi:multicomponent Na+:H+ antiporter subunit F
MLTDLLSVPSLFVGAAGVVLAALLCSLWLVFRGPTPVDRILAAQLMGTVGVATLLLLGTGARRAGLPLPGYLDVALVLALLAGVAGIAFVARGWEGNPAGPPSPPEEVV